VDLTARFLNFVPAGQDPDPSPDALDVDGLVVQGDRASLRRVDRIDQQQALKIVASYLDGLRVSQLAAQFGVHDTTVRAHLRRAGVDLRPFRKLCPDQIVEVRQLHATGVPLADMATQFGVTVSTISRVLAESKQC
jgi:DNA invertase Pin-like site-specific DNA recombinase